MIITGIYSINGKQFIRTYSDNGMMVERDGVQYLEANDPAEYGRQYIETDIPIEVKENDE